MHINEPEFIACGQRRFDFSGMKNRCLHHLNVFFLSLSSLSHLGQLKNDRSPSRTSVLLFQPSDILARTLIDIYRIFFLVDCLT